MAKKFAILRRKTSFRGEKATYMQITWTHSGVNTNNNTYLIWDLKEDVCSVATNTHQVYFHSDTDTQIIYAK